MKARAFVYRRPESIEDAVGPLARYRDEARVLAGGQSRMPMMNLRLASPQMAATTENFIRSGLRPRIG